MYQQDFPKMLSERLGLAAYPLFGDHSPILGRHNAMMDGTAGSFAYSEGCSDAVLISKGVDWAWSANLRYHILLSNDSLYFRRVFSDLDDVFTLSSVVGQIDSFFEYIQRGSTAPVVDVVEHVTTAFRRYRGYSNRPSLSSYLLLLAAYAEGTLASWDDFSSARDSLIEKYKIDCKQCIDISADSAARFNEMLKFNNRIGKELDLGIAIRHAGGALFQDTFAEIVREPFQLSLFGLPQARQTRPDLTACSYYTPQGLARSLSEMVVSKFSKTAAVRVLDPACGSGSFLCEAVRCLSRFGFSGSIELFGYDVSQQAIQMADFAIACVKHDHPDLDVTVKLVCSDFLTASVGNIKFDIVLMNPPFLAWERMDNEVKANVVSALGEYGGKGKPDLSMAFSHKALQLLNENGVLGTILPVGVLTSSHAKNWRNDILHRHTVNFVSTLGDHSLFKYASVNVSALVIENKKTETYHNTTMLWADESNNAASTALRKLRILQWNPGISISDNGPGWNIYSCGQYELARRQNWMPSSSLAGSLVSEIEQTTQRCVSDFFDIKQGIRTGNKSTFIVPEGLYQEFGRHEKAMFRPVAEIIGPCQLKTHGLNYVFYPVSEIKSEEDLRLACPVYFEKVLSKQKNELSGRSRRNASNYWTLSEHRAWMFDGVPRIVSSVFFREGGFALDENCSYAIVQGFGWIPKHPLQAILKRDSVFGLDIMRLYSFVFNSSVFLVLAKEFSSLLSGGYVEVAKKYMSAIPLPDLYFLLQHDNTLSVLANELLDMSRSSLCFKKSLVDDFANRSYKLNSIT